MPNWKKVIVSGSDASLNSLNVTTYISASSFNGSHTGSLLGTASYAINALTASYVANASSFPYTGSAIITGSLGVTGSVSITGSGTILSANVDTIVFTGSLSSSGSLNINGSITGSSFTGSYTGSLFGTASYAITALSASYFSGSVSNTISSSYAATASYVVTAQTASYILNAVSASYATTASYWSGSITNATSASFASTASYVNPLNQNVQVTGSTLISGSGGAAYALDVNGTARVVNNIYKGTVPSVVQSSYVGLIVNNGVVNQNAAYQANSIVSVNDAVNGYNNFTISTIGLLVYSGGATPSAVSSILELQSTTKGFLSPRMTAAQRTAISTPAQGLIVYDTGSTTEGLYYYNSGSNTGWQQVLSNTGSQSISGSLTVTGGITTTGTLTAQTLVVQTVTSSIIYSSGSNVFGNSLANTQQLTGSVGITGSLYNAGSSTLIGNTLIGTTVDNGTDKLQVSGSGKFTGTISYNGNLTPVNTPAVYSLGLSSTSGGGILTAYTNNGASSLQTLTFGYFNTTLTSNNSINNPGYNLFDFSITGTHTAASIGGGNFSNLYINPTINMVGNTSGNTITHRGIYYSPTLTNLTNTAHIAIETVTGNVLLGSTSGNTILGGTTDAGYKLLVSGSSTSGSLNVNNALTVSGSYVNVTSASFNYQQNLTVATGSYTTIASVNTGSYRCAFFDYVAYSGSVVRAGTLQTTWSGSVTSYNEAYTADLGGSTSVVTLQTAISGSNIELQAGISGSAWAVRSLVRLL
jgi:hypothetical protein